MTANSQHPMSEWVREREIKSNKYFGTKRKKRHTRERKQFSFFSGCSALAIADYVMLSYEKCSEKRKRENIVVMMLKEKWIKVA